MARLSTDNGGVIDLHGHQLPGVDDGAADLAVSREAINRMVDQGVVGFSVTPHVRASKLISEAMRSAVVAPLDAAWADLTEMCATEYPSLTVRRGAEVMFDHPLPELLPEWVRLGGTRYVLLEFPSMMIPPRVPEALIPVLRAGYTPVIAHPERYRNASPDGAEALSWKQVGALLQVNCGSLLGQYGPKVAERAKRLLTAGAVDYMAGDYHCRGLYPVREARGVLERAGGKEHAELLLEVNPARILNDEVMADVPPLTMREGLGKVVEGVRKWFGGM
ncbi:MAG: hypothetical protein LBG44_10325 [Gemmatimonadota bacterium]|jgi:protein-tyrosine phosphatase|nr:hypothetical protein [Gemmatimonadota bacterium]